MKLNNFGEVLEHASLKNYNSYGIDSSCRYLVKVFSIQSLIELLNYLKENSIKYYVLGKGSNVILPDDEFSGVIISLEQLNNVSINGNIVESEAGIILGLLVKKVINNNLQGLESLALIPGTLGGALYGNAGVKDHTIYDFLETVTVIRNGELLELKKEDIDISYRNTMFKKTKDIIVKARFKLEDGSKIEMEQTVKNDREKRMNSQPLEYKNAGSVFKNPEGNYAGKLIEQLNLKGYKIGGAEVSLKHANFIINKDNATSEDIIKLIEFIKRQVLEKYDINLELEQIIVRWDEDEKEKE